MNRGQPLTEPSDRFLFAVADDVRQGLDLDQARPVFARVAMIVPFRPFIRAARAASKSV